MHGRFCASSLRQNAIDDSTLLRPNNNIDLAEATNVSLLREISCNDSLQQYVLQAEVRLQQSMSTPSPGMSSRDIEPSMMCAGGEYRRFRSEGSSSIAAGGSGCSSSMPAAEVDEINNGTASTSRAGHLNANGGALPSKSSRLNLFQDSVTSGVSGTLTKHSHTEQVMMMHTLKTKLSKYQSFIDKAFALVAQGSDESIIEVCCVSLAN
jgi:hypothetical protein